MFSETRYAGPLNGEQLDIYENPRRAVASLEEIEAARRALAEFVVEAMDALIAAEQWHPREGITGLERLLADEDADDTIAR
jgi:hypothetical protein